MLNDSQKKSALILSGGGARAAYQVGVLKAIAEIHGRKAKNPFSVISGTSAGAINAVGIAASANNFQLAVKKTEKMWSELRVGDVYKAGFSDIASSLFRLIGSMFNQGIGKDRPLALLDNSPLRYLLATYINYKNIQKRIDDGDLDAVAITASGYESGESVTFFQAKKGIKSWRRANRVGIPTQLNETHLLASSAIPAIMPAEKVNREYFGDGALKQLSPISPALHLHANRALIIGVRGPKDKKKRFNSPHSPSLAHIIGHVFNSAFIDSLEHDVEITLRQNHIINQLENKQTAEHKGRVLKEVDILIIKPSVEFSDLAIKHARLLQLPMRILLNMLGANKGGSALSSFLLFEGAFCKELIEVGYRDGMNKRAEIREFFELD